MALPAKISTITLIGAGNLAWHLGKQLFLKGYGIREVWSRTPGPAAELSDLIGSKPMTDLGLLNKDVDLFIIAVHDDAITETVRKLRTGSAILIHTSGSVPIEQIAGPYSFGVLYPLQTFSKNIPVSFDELPLCIEASDPETQALILQVALSLSSNVHLVNSEDRLCLHLAAVFASNYSNFMYTIARDIVASRGISFDLLRPLLLETAHKVMSSEPSGAQTGPAKRGDSGVIQKHLKLLASMPEYVEIYSLLAEKIRERYQY